MNYLLDTCVVSELTRVSPDLGVCEWIALQPEHSLYLSVLTIGEIHRGVCRLAAGRRRSELQRRLRHDLCERFGSRILPVDNGIALAWGLAQSELEAEGTPMAAVDGLLSATARARDLVLVTRNVRDYTDPKVRIHDPWG